MLWRMRCFALQSMGRANHTFPVYATWNVQTQLKSTEYVMENPFFRTLRLGTTLLQTTVLCIILARLWSHSPAARWHNAHTQACIQEQHIHAHTYTTVSPLVTHRDFSDGLPQQLILQDGLVGQCLHFRRVTLGIPVKN